MSLEGGCHKELLPQIAKQQYRGISVKLQYKQFLFFQTTRPSISGDSAGSETSLTRKQHPFHRLILSSIIGKLNCSKHVLIKQQVRKIPVLNQNVECEPLQTCDSFTWQWAHKSVNLLNHMVLTQLNSHKQLISEHWIEQKNPAPTLNTITDKDRRIYARKITLQPVTKSISFFSTEKGVKNLNRSAPVSVNLTKMTADRTRVQENLDHGKHRRTRNRHWQHKHTRRCTDCWWNAYIEWRSNWAGRWAEGRGAAD